MAKHYSQKNWGSRRTFVPGENSVKENPLTDMNKVLLPDRMKNFVDALDKNSVAFHYLFILFSVLLSSRTSDWKSAKG